MTDIYIETIKQVNDLLVATFAVDGTRISSPADIVADDVQDLRSSFAHFDKDGSGALDRDEMKRVLVELGSNPLSEVEFDELMKAIDLDGSGVIEINEFVAYLTS